MHIYPIWLAILIVDERISTNYLASVEPRKTSTDDYH